MRGFWCFVLWFGHALGLTMGQANSDAVREELQSLKNLVGQLSRQVLLTQMHIEEQVRSRGDSGLKQIRHTNEGTKAYFSETVSGRGFAVIHDHKPYDRTIGMGEVTAVMNGVEFRTRHNDYKLKMPSTTSQDYQATEDIPFPDVPKEVTNLPTAEEQIVEMSKWFEAWRDQNYSVRDYRPYFRPVLCYMEGMWTYSDDTIDESFESDRHFLDANNWFEMQEKTRYQAYSGSKGRLENIAYLPQVVFNVTETGYPVFAQWNYDILCHPLRNDLPLDRLRVVDDLSARMRDQMPLENYKNSRLARFRLNTVDAPFTKESNKRNKLLDSMMLEIPGKNNYDAYFEDKGFEDDIYLESDNRTTTLNAGYYHRNFFVSKLDAMGEQFRYRGFADQNIYMAMTDQDKIAGMNLTVCRGNKCNVISQKWTYAIPLEIIYLTPLSKWNPYNINFYPKGNPNFDAVTAGGRNGKAGKALNGTNTRNFYLTPNNFFVNDHLSKFAVFVLDSNGTERLMRASGHRAFIPNIPGVGSLRQRYPIAPIHDDGTLLWKEIEAMKAIVMDPLAYGHVMYNPITIGSQGSADESQGSTKYIYKLSPSNVETNQHVHEIQLSETEMDAIKNMKEIRVTTSEAEGHVHTLLIYSANGGRNRVKYSECDGKAEKCWDGHPRHIKYMSSTTQ